MTVSRRMRFEILRRDDHACRYCGRRAPEVMLTVDHVAPVALGGTDDPSNLAAACKDCNAGKASTGPDQQLVADVARDAERWADVMQYLAERAHDRRDIRQAQIRLFDEAWSRWECGGRPVPRDYDWKVSISRWLDQCLTVADLNELASDALGSVPGDVAWKSFCARAWRLLRERQEHARTVLADVPARDAPAGSALTADEVSVAGIAADGTLQWMRVA